MHRRPFRLVPAPLVPESRAAAVGLQNRITIIITPITATGALSPLLLSRPLVLSLQININSGGSESGLRNRQDFPDWDRDLNESFVVQTLSRVSRMLLCGFAVRRGDQASLPTQVGPTLLAHWMARCVLYNPCNLSANWFQWLDRCTNRSV